MANTSTMNIQGYLKGAWKIIKEEPLVFIGGGFLYQILFIVSQGLVGIIAGPLMGGYLLLIILYLRENRRPAFNDLLIGFRQFGHLFPYFFVLLLIFIGFALLVIPGLVFATWWIYVLPLMVDRKMPFNEAMRLSMNKVNETGFFMHLVFLLLISLIPVMLVSILTAVMQGFMVLSVLLPPIQFGCLAGLYLDQFRPGKTAGFEKAGNETAAQASLYPDLPETVGKEPAEKPEPSGSAADKTNQDVSGDDRKRDSDGNRENELR